MAPSVSVIVPCYNEARTIEELLEALRSQTVGPGDLGIVIADGGSTDGTRDIIRSYSAAHPELEVQIVDNPDQTIPAAVNRAIEASSGEIVVRLDGHSKPAPDYIEKCLQTVARTDAALVGGRWDIRSGADTRMGRSIAAAASHTLGAGGVRYRVGGEEGPVDGVPFGCYQREWLERIGPFNEALLTNEDYEYIVRIREAGGLVWFNPEIAAVYYARTTLLDLLRQYARYGYWKAQMLRLYPSSIRPRQAVPPLFVLSLLILSILSPFWEIALVALAIESIAYVGFLMLAGLLEAIRKRDAGLMLGFPLAVATMHLAWGGAFIVGLLRRAPTTELQPQRKLRFVRPQRAKNRREEHEGDGGSE